MNIRKKSDGIGSGSTVPKLSKMGKIILAGAAVILVIIIIAMASGAGKKKISDNKKNEIFTAVNTAVQVCTTYIDDAHRNEVEKMAGKVSKEKKAEKAAELAQELITYTLQYVNDTKGIDEINGARGMINVAVKRYNQK